MILSSGRATSPGYCDKEIRHKERKKEGRERKVVVSRVRDENSFDSPKLTDETRKKKKEKERRTTAWTARIDPEKLKMSF